MNRWLSYIRLVRPLELLRIALLLVVAQWSIVQVGLPAEVGRESVGGYFYFVLFAVLLIGAAGFAFNDYYDAKRDAEEQGKMVIVGRRIVRRSVLQMHIAFTLLGVLFGVVASSMVHNLWLLLLFPVAAGLLWYYSTLYRRIFVVGNFLKAALLGGCALLPVLFEVFYLEENAWRSFAMSEISITPMLMVSVCYAGLIGFGALCEQLLIDLYNFVRGVHREKDTLAFRYGTFTAKMVTGSALLVYLSLSIVFFISLIRFYRLHFMLWQSAICGIVIVAVPLLIALMALLAAQNASHFKVSRLAATVGMFGTLLLPAALHILV